MLIWQEWQKERISALMEQGRMKENIFSSNLRIFYLYNGPFDHIEGSLTCYWYGGTSKEISKKRPSLDQPHTG
jgi:hypothetical protein